MNSATEQTFCLGDTVTANYHGLTLTGIITSFDGSGYVYIKTAQPFTLWDTTRDGFGLDRYQRATMKFVARGNVADEQIGRQMGGAYLRTEVAA